MSWVLALNIRVWSEPFDSGKGFATSKTILFRQLSEREGCRHHGKMTSTAKDLQSGFSRPQTRGASLDDAKRLRHFGQNVSRAQQLLPFMRCADHRAKPRFSFRDSGIADRGSKYARLKELLREFERPRCIANMDRDNRRLAHLELKPALLEFALEHFRVGPEFFHQLFAFR